MMLFGQPKVERKLRNYGKIVSRLADGLTSMSKTTFGRVIECYIHSCYEMVPYLCCPVDMLYEGTGSLLEKGLEFISFHDDVNHNEYFKGNLTNQTLKLNVLSKRNISIFL